MTADELFRALGDPTRLEIVRRLSNRESCTISMLLSGLGISRQGARKHLQLLADANIVTLKPDGRDTIVSLNRATLAKGKAFITEIELQWDKRLEALRQYVDNDQINDL